MDQVNLHTRTQPKPASEGSAPSTVEEVLAAIDNVQEVPGKRTKSESMLHLIIIYFPCLMDDMEKPENLLLAIAMYAMSKKKEGDLSLSQSEFNTALEELKTNRNAVREIIQDITKFQSANSECHLTRAVELYNQLENKQVISIAGDVTAQEGPFVSTYEKDIHWILDPHLSFREELNVNTTCTALYNPYRKNTGEVAGFLHSRLTPNFLMPFQSTPKTILTTLPATLLTQYAPSLDTRYLNSYIFATKNQEFLKELELTNIASNISRSYTQRQLIDGHITIAGVQKLNQFVNSYNDKKNFSDEARFQWLAEQLNNDVLLRKNFSPGHTCWPQCISAFKSLDLEMALLLSSKGVQKYASGNVESFCDLIMKASDSDKGKFRSILRAFNNEVFQTYFDEDKLSVSHLPILSKSIWIIRLIEILRNPVIKKYFDEGHFGPGDVSAIENLVRISENLFLLLKSPITRASYEKCNTTWDQLLKVESEAKRLLFGETLPKCLSKGYLNFTEFDTLTETEKNNLRFLDRKWVNSEIKNGKLTIRDVLESSWTFSFYAKIHGETGYFYKDDVYLYLGEI